MSINPIIILKNIEIEGPGLIQKWLEEKSIRFDVLEYYETIDIIDLDIYSAVIILGGPMSANDSYEYIKKEKELINNCMRTELPLLGICLGSQLISKSLGGTITRNQLKEIGVFELSLTSDGRNSKIFEKLPESFKIFQWHGETFSIPPRGKLLATAQTCVNQAFQIGNVFGLQFHIEFTSQMIEKIIEAYIEEVLEENLNPDKIQEEFDRNYQAIKDVGKILFTNFLNLIQSMSKTRA